MSLPQSATSIIEDLEKFNQTLPGDQPDWLNQIRSNGLSVVNKTGLPSTKDEEWKYTNLSKLANNTYVIAQKSELENLDQFNSIYEASDINVVFINGIFSTSLSNIDPLPQGVSIKTISDALKENEHDIKKHLTYYDYDQDTTFIALNNALLRDGLYIHIKKGAVTEKLIHIIHVTKNSKEIFSAPRTLVSCEESSEVTILESHLSLSDDHVYWTNPLTDIFLNENATLHYTKAQKESTSAYHIGNTRVWQERNSNFDGFSFMTGGSIIRNNLDIVLNGEGANTTLNGLYSIFGKQHVDNHTSVDHRQPNCTSNQLYKGILNNASRAVFNGKIFVKPIAQKTNSYQLNKNLLIGKGCQIDTKPQLEIFADDVKCTHGATIGQLNEDEMFYLQTRCIDRKKAVKILSRGFVDDLINMIRNESIQHKLHKLLEPSFAEL